MLLIIKLHCETASDFIPEAGSEPCPAWKVCPLPALPTPHPGPEQMQADGPCLLSSLLP